MGCQIKTFLPVANACQVCCEWTKLLQWGASEIWGGQKQGPSKFLVATWHKPEKNVFVWVKVNVKQNL